MPGHKVVLQDDREIREGLTCAYCKLVLKDPVQTSETGQRLCKECFKVARCAVDLPRAVDLQLDPNDQIWPDFAVKKEIGNLKVKCENCTVGCDWKGLFKQLMQHSQECQYVTVECENPGCGQRVLLSKLEVHLKEECPRRHVSCKDCDKKMYFSELQDHNGVCPSAQRKCKNCDIVLAASKLIGHMINECKHGGCESTKMVEAFKEMTVAFEQAAKRIDTLEKHCWEDAQRIEMLENGHREDTKRIEMLEKRNKLLEMQAIQNASNIQTLENRSSSNERSCDISRDLVNQMEHTVRRVENDMQDYEDKFRDMEKRANRDHFEVVACMQDINTAAVTPSGDKMASYEKPSEFVKQLEEKV